MAADEDPWVEIKRLACDTRRSIVSIAEEFDVHRNAIHRRAAKEFWPLPQRRKVAVKPIKRRAPAKRKVKLRTAETLFERMQRLTMRNLDFVEQQMDNADGTITPADAERITRAFGSAARSFDKLKGMEANVGKSGASTSGQSAPFTPADAERMRLEIAERLERIEARRQSQQGSL